MSSAVLFGMAGWWAWRTRMERQSEAEARRLVAGASMAADLQRRRYGIADQIDHRRAGIVEIHSPAEALAHHRYVTAAEAAELEEWLALPPAPKPHLFDADRQTHTGEARWTERDAVAMHRRALDDLERATPPEPFGHPPSGAPAPDLPQVLRGHEAFPNTDPAPGPGPAAGDVDRPRPARIDDEISRRARDLFGEDLRAVGCGRRIDTPTGSRICGRSTLCPVCAEEAR